MFTRFFVMVALFVTTCMPVCAKELVIAVSDDIPPFVMDKGKGGLEIEIIREALGQKGHTFNARTSVCRSRSPRWGWTRVPLSGRQQMTGRIIRTTLSGSEILPSPRRNQGSF